MFILSLVAGFPIVYVDETGVQKFCQKETGWAVRGQKIHATKPGKRFRRTNIIGGLLNGKHIAVRSYENRTNSAFFEDWFEWDLLGVLPKNAVIIMDNASFHRKPELRKIVDRYGVFLLFLPPYSPDLNPIEHSWANFKKWFSKNSNRFHSVADAAFHYFGFPNC
jgi:transposase